MSKTLELIKKLQKISHLNSIESLLSWDQQVMMPQGGHISRSLQIETLSGIVHDLQTEKDLGKLIEECLKEEQEDKYAIMMVKLAKKNFDKQSKIPKELVEENAKLSSTGYQVWAKARQENKFEDFVPVLKQWIELKKKMAKCIDEQKKPIDVWIDEHDPDMKSSRLDELFQQIKDKIVPLIKKIAHAEKKIDTSFIYSSEGKFQVEKQEKLSKEFSKEIGFSFENGRLDVSTHPFTINIDRKDVRITSRYRNDDLLQGLTGAIHESGHAMYEQGRNEKYYGTPVSNAHGISLHESQSLLWERHIGLSKPFWKRYWSKVQETFTHIPNNLTSDDIYLAANVVEPTFIRVESDEVTYPMHVILRYEIEQGLFDGSIQVEDLPKVWNQKMKEYLGIIPETDTKGVLQDIHWSFGAFGYFPSYLCGAMLAAHIFNHMKTKIENLDQKIIDGNFNILREWLNKNIHEKGSLLSLDDLMIEVTGEKLNPKYFIDYLEKKYTEIYDLKN